MVLLSALVDNLDYGVVVVAEDFYGHILLLPAAAAVVHGLDFLEEEEEDLDCLRSFDLLCHYRRPYHHHGHFL